MLGAGLCGFRPQNTVVLFSGFVPGFISLEMSLAKAEGLEGKQNQQHTFQSYEAEEGIYATHSSGPGLCLTKTNFFYHLIVLQ